MNEISIKIKPDEHQHFLLELFQSIYSWYPSSNGIDHDSHKSHRILQFVATFVYSSPVEYI